MPKDIIMCSIYRYNDYGFIKTWVNSIKQTSFDGDIAIVAINISDEMSKTIKDNGVNVYRYEDNTNIHPNVLRFKYIHQSLQDIKGSRIVLTDARDVMFQKNPFDHPYMLSNKHDIIASSENILLKNEWWSKKNVINTFGAFEYKKIKNYEAICAGVIAGKTEKVAELCLEIYQMSLQSRQLSYDPGSIDLQKHWSEWSSDPADQAAFNILLKNNKWRNVSKIANLDSAWNINFGVSNQQNVRNLLMPTGSIEDGVVKNNELKSFFIVHQYDRIEWFKNMIAKKYEL